MKKPKPTYEWSLFLISDEKLELTKLQYTNIKKAIKQGDRTVDIISTYTYTLSRQATKTTTWTILINNIVNLTKVRLQATIEKGEK